MSTSQPINKDIMPPRQNLWVLGGSGDLSSPCTRLTGAHPRITLGPMNGLIGRIVGMGIHPVIARRAATKQSSIDSHVFRDVY